MNGNTNGLSEGKTQMMLRGDDVVDHPTSTGTECIDIKRNLHFMLFVQVICRGV